MKKRLILTQYLLPALMCSLLPISAMSAPKSTADTRELSVSSVQAQQTYTYVRCWFRPQSSHDDPSTDWEWARNSNGSYFKLTGYWYSAVSFKNMFYTNESQSTIAQRCQQTLGANHSQADITYFAADNRWSYNHTIWSNTSSVTPTVDKMVSFGDSISDTGNIYNASQWLFPNDNAWFLGHFSNGLVWTEYLAKQQQLPLYNWAIGGAAGSTQYVLLSGVLDQVKSYIQYMNYANNYDPAKTLFTLEFGLNDFLNYGRSASAVTADFKQALETLEANGAQHILVLNLPDATIAPQFKYSEPGEAAIVKAKIDTFNAFASQQVATMQSRGINIQLFDTETLLADMVSNPASFGLRNTTDSCLDINRSSSSDYLHSHSLRNDCATYGSDTYVFWDVTHPTTKTHKVIADAVNTTLMQHFK
jgi:thermolabile hemolysin